VRVTNSMAPHTYYSIEKQASYRRRIGEKWARAGTGTAVARSCTISATILHVYTTFTKSFDFLEYMFKWFQEEHAGSSTLQD
jgi:hypothetical protein